MFWQNVKNVTFQMMQPKYANLKLCKKTLKNVSWFISDIRRTDTRVGTVPRTRTGLGSLSHVLRRSIFVSMLWSIKVIFLSFTLSKQLIFIGQNTLLSISLSGRLKLTQNVIMKGFTISYYDFFIWMDLWHMNSVNRYWSLWGKNDKKTKILRIVSASSESNI